MTDNIPPEQPSRRSLLGWAAVGIGAIFSAIIGFPIVCYVIDPRHRKGPKSTMKLVEGVKLDELVLDPPKPVQGVVRDTRTDAWTLYPNDVIGRVWVVRMGARPDLSTPEKVEAFNIGSQAKKEDYLIVFTTICPHLGCSVNLNNTGNGFLCPCHAASYDLNGERTGANPAKRGMDTLAWNIDPADPDANRILVEYRNFKTLEEKKVPLG
jgi:menaquinol-cytochrome c reductase iron-sulfur subunit